MGNAIFGSRHRASKDRSEITKPALVITGTQDITSPPVNSVMLSEKIPEAWLVQIDGAGHGLMFQYPEIFEKVLETFL